MKVMITAPYMLPEIDRFRPIFSERGITLVVPSVNERMEEADLLPLVGDIDGTICGDDRYTARVLDAAPRLRVIAKWGTGIDSIDRAACAARGVAVLNTPNAFSEPVADSVLGYMLCFARRLPWMDRAVRETGWRKIPSVSLGECTLGIVGVGNVGRAVARRAAAFGMQLLGCDPIEPPADLLTTLGMTMVDFPTLLSQSDFISINCDLNPTSLHLIDDAALAQVKPGAVLINTARGPVVDEPALIAALQAGRLAGAALDVFEDEPLPDASPLRTMEQVMLAPHNANSSPVAWERVHTNTIRNLLRGLGLEEGGV
jgi:D-3-phosphoglycerate dehydrogenase